MRRAMGHRNTLIRTYVLAEITIKLSGALRKAGISGNMKRDVESSVYWPVTHNVRGPKESIEQNVKPVE
jgi:hypothetical protein